METKKCKSCELYNHNLNDDGLCANCLIKQERTLCSECEVYWLKEGETCSHNKEGLEYTKENQQKKEEALKSIFPEIDNYDGHLGPMLHYYGMFYEGFGPVEEYRQHFNGYIREYNLHKSIVKKITNLYHAMYGTNL